MNETNFYGQPIVPPEHFDGEHVANPGPAGMPSVCSCGWTRHGGFEMNDHLRDMGQDDPALLRLAPDVTRWRIDSR